MRGLFRLASAGLVALPAGTAWAEDDSVAIGHALVASNCSQCHAITRSDESAHGEAPAFRTLSTLYPIESLAEALAEGIVVGHPDMPEFVATPDQIDAIIAYLESIQE